MKIGGIIKNDFAAAPGVCVTVFVQGCSMNPHCPGCHNPELQPFDGGRELTIEELTNVRDALYANGIKRSLCIMGGEPLAEGNLATTGALFAPARFNERLPIYIWTGYLYEDLLERAKTDAMLHNILSGADYLIDGPYVEQERDVSLFMRGSRNQRIIDLRTGKDVTSDFEKKETT